MLPPSFLPKVDKKRHLLLISEERSITSQGGWVKSLDQQGIVLLQRASRASFLAWVEEDMLQPVKGIELREEDRGEMVPNMGIKSVPVLSPTARTNAPHVHLWISGDSYPLLTSLDNKVNVFGQRSFSTAPESGCSAKDESAGKECSGVWLHSDEE